MRVVVLGAGGPAGVNFINCLRRSSHPYWISAWDAEPMHLAWCDADSRVVIPPVPLDFVDKLRGFCDVNSIDLVYAQPDALVPWMARFGGTLGQATTFQPGLAVIETCQSKLLSNAAWSRVMLAREAIPLGGVHDNPAALEEAAEAFGYPYWIRATDGAGGRGATLAGNRRTAKAWLDYWNARGERWQFIAEPYLPGRNLAFMSVWADGRLCTSTLRERLAYIYPNATPSGVTGTSAISRSLHDQEANEIATRAVLAVDVAPHGVYCVDLKDDEDGRPTPTEINVGRFFTVCDFAAALGANLPDYFCRLAVGADLPDLPPYDAAPAGYLWKRHIDCPAVLEREIPAEVLAA